MFKRARQNISNDFHVAMRVRRETLAGPDSIFVDDAQAVEMRVRRVEVLIEREGVIGFKPPKIKVAARFRFANSDHSWSAGILAGGGQASQPADQTLTTEGTEKIESLS